MNPATEDTAVPQPAGLPISLEDLQKLIQASVASAMAQAQAAPASEPQRKGSKRASRDTSQPSTSKVPRAGSLDTPLECSAQTLDPSDEEESPFQEALSSSSLDSEMEEEEEEQEPAHIRSARLFNPDAFSRVYRQVMATLNLTRPMAEQPAQEASGSTEFDVSSVLPAPREPPSGFPLPPPFLNIIQKEWANLGQPTPKMQAARFYRLAQDQAPTVRSPVVDAPIASIGAPSLLPSDSEGTPKDPHDRRVEMAARRSFEAAAGALKASSAASLAVRTAVLWLQRLQDRIELPKAAQAELRSVSSMVAFAADATCDSMQLAARSMAASVQARRATWLRGWEGDAPAINRLVNLPFKGEKLFGEGLEPFLLDAGGKRKVLPSKQKLRPQPFPAGQGYKTSFRPFQQRKEKRAPFYSRGQTSGWQPRGRRARPQQRQQPSKGHPKPQQ